MTNQTVNTDYVVSSVRNSLGDDQMIALAGSMLDSISQANAVFTSELRTLLTT
jgi:hypothetical protein